MKSKEYTSFDELELPEILYKYRNWEDPYHKTLITRNELYFASPMDFEDEKDCMNLLDYSLLTDDDIFNRYYDHSIRDNSNWNDDQHRNFAKKWFDKGLLRQEERLAELMEKHNRNFYNRFGILSVTENFKNPKMWVKYGNNRKGFCVGLNTRELLKNIPILGGGIINYVEELPKIHPFENLLETYVRQIHTKEAKWTFEQEYRLRKWWEHEIDNDSRVVKFNPEAIEHIVFGAKISIKDKAEIKEAIGNENIDLKYTQMRERG